MTDNDKKIVTQEVKADSLPIVIVYKQKEYILKDNTSHTGLILIKKEY